jgi:hypothetical protein
MSALSIRLPEPLHQRVRELAAREVLPFYFQEKGVFLYNGCATQHLT